MKTSLPLPIPTAARPLAGRLSTRCASLFALAVATGLGAASAFSQGTYYPVAPPGVPSPGNYTGTPYVNTAIQGATYNELAYVESLLPGGVTLRQPVPAGKTLATDAQLATAVGTAAQNLVTNLAAVQSSYPGVTLASLAREIAADRPSAASSAVAGSNTLDMIALQIVANSSSSSVAIASLNSVVSTLAATYPTSVATYVTPIFQRAAANGGTLSGLGQLAVTASSTVSPAGSPNDAAVAGIVSQALAQATSASVPAGSRAGAVQSIISQELQNPQVNGSFASIQAVSSSATTSAVLASSGLTLTQVLQIEVNSLPSQANTFVGALVTGALVSNGSPQNAAAVQSAINFASPNTTAYTDRIIGGFQNSSSTAAFSAYLAQPGNAAYADAAVAGAAIKNTVMPPALVQIALSQGTALAQNIIAAAITADLANSNSNSVAIATAAVNTATHAPYSGANTFSAIAQGAVSAARPADAGAIAYTLIQNSSLSTADVQNIVTGSITGAYATSKQSSLSNIVYNAVQANSSVPANQATVVAQAISTMKAQDPSNPSLPTYIAAAAALAGSTGNSNLSAIQTAANNQDSISNGGSGSAAINAAYNVVNSIRTNASTLSGFTKTLNSFSSGLPQDQVLAVLYGGSLADSGDASAILAAAIAKTTSVSSANLLSAAVNASQDIAAVAAAKQAKITSLTVASVVASHIQTNIASGHNTDILDFVGYQAAQNPNNVFDVAAAAATVDPNHANYEAHAIAFNSPTTASNAVAALFSYSQLNTKFRNGTVSTPIDRTSAAAAIVAGLTTGVVETKGSATMTDAAVGIALQNIVQEAVKSAVMQNGQLLTGAVISQSNGTTAANKLSVGAAGVITGLVSQLAQPGDTTIGNSIVSQAVIQQIFQTASTNASAYVLQMAQAAGQALRFVAGNTVAGTAGADIATGFFGTGPQANPGIGGWSYTQVLNAANYGISQAASGIVGAGASGVVNYTLHSATGTPVTDIFNL